MSDRSMWKMLHLLYTLRPGQRGLSDQQLADVGIDCDPDTIQPLVGSGVAAFDGALYSLTESTKMILRSCVVANRRWPADHTYWSTTTTTPPRRWRPAPWPRSSSG